MDPIRDITLKPVPPEPDADRMRRIQSAWDRELRRQEAAGRRLLEERLAARESNWSI